MRIAFPLFVCLLLSGLVQAQQKLKVLNISVDRVVADNLGYVYSIKGDQLTKYDTDGKVLQVYSDKLLGDITAVDASNPMKFLVYYRPLTRVAILDNRMSLRGRPLALDELGLDQAILACTSHSSGLWFYDNASFELIRLDQDLQRDRSTGNLVQMLRKELHPTFLFELNNWLYMHDPSIGLLVFDIYGTYYKTIPLPELEDLHLHDNKLFYRIGQELIAVDLKTQAEKRWMLDTPAIKQVLTTKTHWYLLTDNQLSICKPLP